MVLDVGLKKVLIFWHVLCLKLCVFWNFSGNASFTPGIEQLYLPTQKDAAADVTKWASPAGRITRRNLGEGGYMWVSHGLARGVFHCQFFNRGMNAKNFI